MTLFEMSKCKHFLAFRGRALVFEEFYEAAS